MIEISKAEPVSTGKKILIALGGIAIIIIGIIIMIIGLNDIFNLLG